MKKIKNKLFKNTWTRLVLGMFLAILLTTSVFASTGLLNSNPGQTVVSSQELQDHIKNRIITQLEAKIQELLESSNSSELSQKIAERIDTEDILNRLRQEIEEKLSGFTKNLDINSINALIDNTIDSILDALIDEIVSVAINDAITGLSTGDSFSVDSAIRALIESEIKDQINKIILDNVDAIIDSTLDKLLPGSSGIDITTPTESVITISSGVVTIIPGSAYYGKTVEEFLVDNSTELSLKYSTDPTYGMFITNIGNIITGTYHAVKEGNQLMRYDYYVSFYVNGNYADVGVSSEIITDSKVFTFKAEDWKQGDVLAEIIVYEPGNLAYQVNVWGMTQSPNFHSYVLKVYSNLTGATTAQKVQDVLEKLEFKITNSGTGYAKFEYNGVVITQSTIVGGVRAFVPTVYKVNSSSSLSYASGVTTGKSSTETVVNGSTGTYFLAQEWDGKTAVSAATFE